MRKKYFNNSITNCKFVLKANTNDEFKSLLILDIYTKLHLINPLQHSNTGETRGQADVDGGFLVWAGGRGDRSHIGGVLRANCEDKVHTRSDAAGTKVQGIRSRRYDHHKAGRCEGRVSGSF